VDTGNSVQESEARCEQLVREAQAAGRREQAALASLDLRQGEVERLLEELNTGAQLLHKVRTFNSPGFFLGYVGDSRCPATFPLANTLCEGHHHLH
jgi:hypothetical protein